MQQLAMQPAARDRQKQKERPAVQPYVSGAIQRQVSQSMQLSSTKRLPPMFAGRRCLLASDVRRAAVDVKRSADVKSSAPDDMTAASE